MSSFGERLRQLRKEKKMTQQELGGAVVTASMISQIESGKAVPSEKLVRYLSDRLGIDAVSFEEERSQKSDQLHAYRTARALMDASQYKDAVNLLVPLVQPLPPQIRPENLYADLALCYERLQAYDDARTMYERVVGAALDRDDVQTAVHAYNNLAHMERRRNDLPMARMFWQRASSLLARHPDVRMPLAARIAGNLGRVYLTLGQFKEALDRYQQAERLATQLASPTHLANIWHGISSVYLELGQYGEALAYASRAQDLYTQADNDRGVFQCRLNLVGAMRGLSQYDTALRFLEEMLADAEASEDPYRTTLILRERAAVRIKNGQYEEALLDAAQALQGTKEPSGKATLLLLRAQAYLKLGAIDPAQDILHTVLNLAQAHHLRGVLFDAYTLQLQASRTSKCDATTLAGLRVFAQAVRELKPAVGESGARVIPR